MTTISNSQRPPWWGVICGAYGDGDPGLMLSNASKGVAVNPTPTNISTTVARCSWFLLQAPQTVNTIRFYCPAAVSSTYRCALYSWSYNALTATGTLTRLTNQLSFNTVAAAWSSIDISATPVDLSPQTFYAMAVAVSATGTTAGLAAFTSASSQTVSALPDPAASAMGSLSAVSQYTNNTLWGFPVLNQFTVTAGALPASVSTSSGMAGSSTWTGGMPAFWLDSV